MADTDTYRPAFFEVYAAEHLSSALRPALRFVLEVLSVRYPRFIRIASWSDEIFTSLLLILETSQLRKDAALLAESFYSLRRTSTLSFATKDLKRTPLSSKHILFTVILSVVVPHLKAKLDVWYSNSTGGAAAELFDAHIGHIGPVLDDEEDQTTVPSSTLSNLFERPNLSGPFEALKLRVRQLQRVYKAVRKFLNEPIARRLTLKWYPRITTVGESINLAYNLMYLFGHSRHFSFPLAMQGLVLRRRSAGELLLDMPRSTARPSQPGAGTSLSDFASSASEGIMGVLKAGFFASIFAFRFLQYYYAAEASVPHESGPMIPPPEPLMPVPGIDRKTALAPGICPICQQPRNSPTACSTSGYVFCYLCIVQEVQRTQRCPITLAPTRIDDLVRVYDVADAG